MNWKWLAITKAVKEGIKKEEKKTKETRKAFEGKMDERNALEKSVLI